MSDKFDEPVTGLAQSVTRRGAFKKFGLGRYSAGSGAGPISNSNLAMLPSNASWFCESTHTYHGLRYSLLFPCRVN
jgi:hypothetical protein